MTTIAARNLAVGHHVVAVGIVSRIDATTTPGVVAVWVDGNTAPKADLIASHGDPVIIRDLNDWSI
jgi:hypothetical protein